MLKNYSKQQEENKRIKLKKKKRKKNKIDKKKLMKNLYLGYSEIFIL